MFKSLNISQSVVKDASIPITLLEIRVPKSDSTDVHFSALAAEQMFATLHGLLDEDSRHQEYFSFEICADDLGVKFYVTAPDSTLNYLENQIYAQYPTAQTKKVSDYTVKDLSNKKVSTAYLKLEKISFFPIKVFRDFEIDPLATIMSTLSEVLEGQGIWVQFLIKPIKDGWQTAGHNYVTSVREGRGTADAPLFNAILSGVYKEFTSIAMSVPEQLLRAPDPSTKYTPKPQTVIPKLTSFQEAEVKAIENKLSKMGFEVVIRILTYGDVDFDTARLTKSLAASFKQYSGVSFNNLLFKRTESYTPVLHAYKERLFDTSFANLLTNEEIATVFHLPVSREEAPNVTWVLSKTGEPPANLPVEDCNYIGETIYRGKKVRFGIKNGDDRLRHMYLIGKTGAGKSTLIENMIIQDIVNGSGVGVLDPHGETIDKVLKKIPDNRLDDVILFDPSDTAYPIGLNLLELDNPSQKNLMASALVSAIKQHFDFSWGPRLEYILNYAILTLAEVPGTTMLGITRLLEDDNYRNFILHSVKDPVVLMFWEREFKEMKNNQKLVTEAIAPIQNKVNRFLASPTIRNILGQKKSTINFDDIMNTEKILLLNLSKGKIGADNANLLGALLVSRIQFTALKRANMPYEQRKPFYLYVDEFQNFATGSFESILSESRKYKLGLYLTHQYTSQLPEEILHAVFGNVGTILSFSVGAPDAQVLSNEFAPYFSPEDLISLDKFHVYIKLMVDGMTSLPFSAKILLPWIPETQVAPDTNNLEKIIQRSREKYGVSEQIVSERISKWVQTSFDKGFAIALEHKAKKGI